MQSLQTLAARQSRLHISSRYRSLRRAQSTQSASKAEPAIPQTTRPTSFLRRNRSALIWSTLGLSLGLLGGNAVLHTLAPPALPEPGTHGDAVLMADLNQRIDNEFKVKVLRGKCLGVTAQLKGNEGGWVELVHRADASDKSESFVNSLAGAKGLGVERIFWDRSGERLVAVVWLGGALSGWPGITHGGVIASQFTEKLALAAALRAEKHGSSTNVLNSAAIPQRLPGTGAHAKMYLPATPPAEPAQLTLSYVKPTYANNFYVIRVSPALPLDQDPADIVPGEPVSGTHDLEATLESLDSRINVKAKAKFAHSTVFDRVEAKAVNGTKQAYTDFKQWLWPSRQASSQA